MRAGCIPALDWSFKKFALPAASTVLVCAIVAVPTEGNQSSSPEEADCVRDLVDRYPEFGNDLGRQARHRTSDIASGHPDYRALQRAGVRTSGSDCRSAYRNGRQVSGAGSTHRHLFDDDIELCGCAARYGVPLQPQPPKRGDVAREMRLHPCGVSVCVRGPMSDASPDAACQCVLPVSRISDCHLAWVGLRK